MKIFDNFKELQERYPKLARKLLNDVGRGKWQGDALYVYDGLPDFAEYELTEGWYGSAELGQDNYNGAPDPLDFVDPNDLGLEDADELWDWAEYRPVSDIVEYIDLEEFGESLTSNWDESCNWTDGSAVITTGYGW